MKISRNALVAAVAIAAVAACSRTADVPRPTHTLEPSVTPTERVKPTTKRLTACTLMTSEERQALAGTTMDQVMPSNPATAENHCEWVHSFKEANVMSVKVEARDARDWARRSATGLGSSLAKPRADRKRLGEFLGDLRSGKLTREGACEMYRLMMIANGAKEGAEVVYPIGGYPMSSVVSTSCVDGVYTAVSYAEPNLYPTWALGDQVVKARQAVEKRAVERFGPDAQDASATPGPVR